MAEPRVIYEARPRSPFHGDRAFHHRLRAETPTLLDRFLVPTRSGRAWLGPVSSSASSRSKGRR